MRCWLVAKRGTPPEMADVPSGEAASHRRRVARPVVVNLESADQLRVCRGSESLLYVLRERLAWRVRRI